MDRIVVMDNGKIVEQGSPRALLEQEGSKGIRESRFRKLIRVDSDRVLEQILSKAKI
jgi:ABC-type multidrug transport system fused ATPase/permease subunit